MNEKFRELAMLAVADAAKYCQRPFDLNREENETFAMSFAELIVQRCIGVVADAVAHRDPASTYADKIKQHFGVE